MAVLAMPRAISDPLQPMAGSHARPSIPSAHISRETPRSNCEIPPPSNVRRRRDRPCDACRRRKSRCVIHEGKTLCVLCEFHNQECTFLQQPLPRKRKLPDGDAPSAEASRKRAIDGSTPATSPSHPSESSAVACSPCWEPFALSESLGLHLHKFSRYIGLTTPFDPTFVSLSAFDAQNESQFPLGTLRKVSEHECFIMLPDECSADHGGDADARSAMDQIVQPHGDRLIALYFRIVHPNFPIVQKRLFLEQFRQGDCAFAPSLLAGMYLLALNWWSHDPTLATERRPDSAALESIAMRSLAAAMTRPKLTTVQAGLLLLQRPEADAWSLTTQLVAIGQELGLHLECNHWSIPDWEKGLRKRIAWALYMQDKWSSLIHGRPSHIFAANWAVGAISDADFVEGAPDHTGRLPLIEEDADDGAKGRILFIEMISLTAIMSEIMDTFYTQTAIRDFKDAGPQSTQLILERAKPVQIRLKEWFSKLPTVARMDNFLPGMLSGTGFLHLAYFATEITLHRRIIQSLSTLPLPSVSGSSTPAAADCPSTTSAAPTTDAYLIHICRSAAKTRLISAMDFVNRLKPEHLQAFWYFPSTTNFTLIGTFGSLLWATALTREEAQFYQHRLSEYRWTLGVSRSKVRMQASSPAGGIGGGMYRGPSRSARKDGEGFLEGAVRMLDASRAVLSNLAEKPSLAHTAISRAGVPAPAVMIGDFTSDSEESGNLQDVEMNDATPLTHHDDVPDGELRG